MTTMRRKKDYILERPSQCSTAQGATGVKSPRSRSAGRVVDEELAASSQEEQTASH